MLGDRQMLIIIVLSLGAWYDLKKELQVIFATCNNVCKQQSALMSYVCFYLCLIIMSLLHTFIKKCFNIHPSSTIFFARGLQPIRLRVAPPWIIACIRPWNIFNLKSRAPYIYYVYAHDTNTHVHTHTHTFCSIDCLCVLYKDNTKLRQIEGDERDIQIKSQTQKDIIIISLEWLYYGWLKYLGIPLYQVRSGRLLKGGSENVGIILC